MASTIFSHKKGTDFVPLNSHELLGVHSPIFTDIKCSFLCRDDPQCRIFVFDPSTCRLYEGAREAGQVNSTFSTTIVAGEILYDDIDSSSLIISGGEYLGASFRFTHEDGTTYDAQIFEFDRDTCLAENFTFPITSNSFWIFAPT